ncbi:hypothetical protein [Asticcacaulis machinosus]|uniref:Uncharacterized protein n=1 Tax=Asticcacaulis machinosus TaxID=2984211 RepID=A0ABT5HFA6_9CAUL|nr:hypothetical protein [Asticcacaulis machinosus]MDC7674862.1 hypothetical protein [Asticcacaulis machinosus]
MTFKCDTPLSDLPETSRIQIRCTKCKSMRQTTPRDLMRVGRFSAHLKLAQLEDAFECDRAACRSPVTFTSFGGLNAVSA